MSARPAAVLFACNFNRVRSPMAEGLMRRLYGDSLFVDSCGLTVEDGVDPLAVQVMREVGVDVSGHLSKCFEDLQVDSFDLVVALTRQSQAHAEAGVRSCAVAVEYWDVLDPTLTEGSREAVLEGYRQVRDILEARMIERFGPPTAVGATPA